MRDAHEKLQFDSDFTLNSVFNYVSNKFIQYANSFHQQRLFPAQHYTELADTLFNQRTNGPVNAHLISWPSKAQNIQNLENIW